MPPLDFLMATITRWVGFFALAALIGSLIVDLLVLPDDAPELRPGRRRLQRLRIACIVMLSLASMAEVIVHQTHSMDRAIKCLRTMDPAFHEHAVEVNRLENTADALLRDSLAALFEEQGDPIEVIKWKEIYETMEIVTDRCEDVANVIEGIILKMA